MKKLTSILLTLCLMLSLFAFAANAAEATITVTVTIADHDGSLAVAAEPVAVRDVDSDGKFTIHDTLTCAHEQYYGAAGGYEAGESAYGFSMIKLWGQTNGGWFMYYRNDAACYSLLDQVEAGDRVAAFLFQDTTAGSDSYTFCDPYTLETKTGKLVKLTVKKAAFDENWNPVELPVVGATITVDGEKTRFVTNQNGEVRIYLNEEGEHLISITSDKEILVPFAVRAQVANDTLSHVLGLLLNVFYPVVNWVMNLINK